MSDIYLQANHLFLSLSSEKIMIKTDSKEAIQEIGIDKVDNILIFGNSQLTTQLIKHLLLKKVTIHYFTGEGRYLSTVDSGREADFDKQKSQVKAHFDSQFRIELARKMISSKLRNQMNLLKSFDDDKLLDSHDYRHFSDALDGIAASKGIQEIMGYEGRCAKSYFYFLSLLLPEQFHFLGRSRQPAKDAFNSLLNFGYSVLYSFMVGMIRKSGLSPGFGMIHENHGHHASLASDLMEEWRPVIVDDLVMTQLRKGVFELDDFVTVDHGGVFLKREAQRRFLKALSSRMLEIHAYLEKSQKRYTFLYMVELQMEGLVRSFKEKNPDCYPESFTGE